MQQRWTYRRSGGNYLFKHFLAVKHHVFDSIGSSIQGHLLAIGSKTVDRAIGMLGMCLVTNCVQLFLRVIANVWALLVSAATARSTSLKPVSTL